MMMTNYKWSTDLIKIYKKVKRYKGEIRIVGGYIRDYLNGVRANDFDLATNLKPCIILEIFKNDNFSIITTGIKYGTITLKIKKQRYEISSLRKDIQCSGRHAKTLMANCSG